MAPDPAHQRPLCFVAMPFEIKQGPDGIDIDFDALYRDIIEPAIADAGMMPLRADEEQVGGVIHKLLFERLLLSDYVIADLTTASANVFYELGIRHAIRPYSTVLIAASGTRLPFDVAPDRTLMYDADLTKPDAAAASRERITEALRVSMGGATDSPVFQLVTGFGPPDIEHIRTDAFRDRVEYSNERKRDLREARAAEDSLDALDRIRAELGDIKEVEAGIAVDLFLSYRDVSSRPGYERMVELVEAMPRVLRRTPLIREQYGFALNRLGRRQDAIEVLERLVEERGPSSETLGILGRVHKDLWQDSVVADAEFEARGHLRRAIDVYVQGFESDWRDAYPGINAVTLMEVAEPPDPRRRDLVPVVVYSAGRRAGGADSDYWDHATLFEAAVLADDRALAEEALSEALARQTAPWEPETTLKNLRLIMEARARRGASQEWYEVVAAALERAMR